MKKIRIGKDIEFSWKVLTNGEETSLAGRDLRLLLQPPVGNPIELSYTVSGCTMSFLFPGTSQKCIGSYSITLWENYGKTGQTVVDSCKAFELVQHTHMECDVPDVPQPDLVYITRTVFNSKVAEINASIDKKEDDFINITNAGIATALTANSVTSIYTASELFAFHQAGKRVSAFGFLLAFKTFNFNHHNDNNSIEYYAGYYIITVDHTKKLTISDNKANKSDVYTKNDANSTFVKKSDFFSLDALELNGLYSQNYFINGGAKWHNTPAECVAFTYHDEDGIMYKVLDGTTAKYWVLHKQEGTTSYKCVAANAVLSDLTSLLNCSEVVKYFHDDLPSKIDTKADRLLVGSGGEILCINKNYYAGWENTTLGKTGKKTSLPFEVKAGDTISFEPQGNPGSYITSSLVYITSYEVGGNAKNSGHFSSVNSLTAPEDGTAVMWCFDKDFDGWIKVNDCLVYDPKNLTTRISAVEEGVDNVSKECNNLVETTWSVLKALRDASNLIPGQQYRITDFVTTTSTSNTQSAGHAFDVIVTADSTSALSEDARACLHSGDTYFANYNLSAWKLKYCLDNDTTRFAWADTTNGKGVIYHMKDEWENECFYDFKNIQFIRQGQISYTFGSSIDRTLNGENKGNTICAYMIQKRMALNFLSMEYASFCRVGRNCRHVMFYNINHFEYVVIGDCSEYIYITGGLSAFVRNLHICSNTVGEENNEIHIYEQKPQSDNYTTYYSLNAEGELFSWREWEHKKLISTTWSNLKALRDAGKLIPGQQYRITDYHCTTSEDNTQSADHQFDIIVVADNEKTLNENARACLTNYDTYFVNHNLSAWELKYSLDNDDSKYKWADTTNGKGVVYYMKDEWGNECPYDFKNIQFKVGDTFVYTFGGATDKSLDDCHHNVMGEWVVNKKQYLNFNTFGYDCSNNTFGANCYSNALGNGCDYNNFGKNCYNNTFGNTCYNNTLSGSCFDNTFAKICSGNKFGNNCSGNTLNNDCTFNTFGGNCNDNTLGVSCDNNTFGLNCNNITFAKTYCRYITIEAGVQYVNLTTSQTTSYSVYLQNVYLNMGVSGTQSKPRTISVTVVGQVYRILVKHYSDKTMTVQ